MLEHSNFLAAAQPSGLEFVLDTAHASAVPEQVAAARPAVAVALRNLVLLVAAQAAAGIAAGSIGLVAYAVLHRIPLAAVAVHSSRIH